MPDSKMYTFKVHMSCEGCAKAIANVLNKHKDKPISKFNIDLPSQTVTVETTLSADEILEILKKTGKNPELIEGK